jgi:hypothetical protein
MAFQPVEDTVEIDMIFTYNGVTAQNVFYAELPSGYNLTDLEDLAAQVDVNWQGNWRTEQPSEVQYLRTEVRGLAVINDLFVSDDTSSNAGTHIGDALPNNVTFAIKKESGQTGRSARGRTYWIGIPADEITEEDENQLEDAFIALIVANVDSVRTSIAAVQGWNPVLVSRFTGGAQRAEGKTFPWLATSNVGTRIDTQRRRLPD